MLTTVLAVTVLLSFTFAADTGCDMTPGSSLMRCLGDYASVPPVAAATGAAGAAELCEVYNKLAGCWAEGTYCREWLPTQLAADKLCALVNDTLQATSLQAPSATSTTSASSSSASVLASSAGSANLSTLSSSYSINGTLFPAPTSLNFSSTITSAPSSTASSSSTSSAEAADVPSETLESVIAEASRVITSIWNNDSGTDIPVISNDIGTQTRPTWTKAGETSPGQTTPPTPTAAAGTVGGSAGGTSGAGQTTQSTLAWLGVGFSALFGAVWVI